MSSREGSSNPRHAAGPRRMSSGRIDGGDSPNARARVGHDLHWGKNRRSGVRCGQNAEKMGGPAAQEHEPLQRRLSNEPCARSTLVGHGQNTTTLFSRVWQNPSDHSHVVPVSCAASLRHGHEKDARACAQGPQCECCASGVYKHTHTQVRGNGDGRSMGKVGT